LLAELHVSLLREDAIVTGLAELFEAFGGQLPGALSTVTGLIPSADIEQRMVIGMHGPREVHVAPEPS
jgi:L-lactate utilization protein LutC